MATFELTAPDGGTYHVDAPDEHAAAAALGQMLGGSKTSEAPTQAGPAAEAPSTLQTIREAIHAPTRSLENGAFLGLGDRARALIDTAVSAGKEGYSPSLAKEQGETEDFRNAHPIAAPVLEASGGIVAPLAVVGCRGQRRHARHQDADRRRGWRGSRRGSRRIG
jgi:hypothetical protein